MDTNKAAYWIALGVLALGLNNEYRQGNFVALHRIAGRADAVMCRVSTCAEQTLAAVRGLTDHEEFNSGDQIAGLRGAEMARAQGELLREQAQDEVEQIRDQVRDRVRDEILAQADVIRARAEVQRAQIEQIRFRTQSHYRLARTDDRADGRRVTIVLPKVCPKIGMRIAVDAGPGRIGHISEETSEIEDTF
jgi:hypothetical protein